MTFQLLSPLMLRTTSRLLSLSHTLRPIIPKPVLRSQFRMSGSQIIHTKEACPPAAAYSQAIRANGQIFVSGQIPADKDGNLVQGSIGDLTRACCDNVKAILTAANSSVEKIVKVNVFITDMAHFAEMNEAYAEFFLHKPARSCVAVHQLPKGVLVEIECIALE